MGDGFVRVAPDNTGKKVATQEFTRGSDTVERQEVVIGGTTDAQRVLPANAVPSSTDYGLPVRNIGTQPVAGDVAAGATDSGNPVKGGGVANSALPAAVAAGQRSNFWTDLFGRLVVLLSGPRDLDLENTITLTSTTETTLLAAVASTKIDLTNLIIMNGSATAVRVDFRDDTGGSVRFAFYLAAGDTRGIANARPFCRQTAANKNWTAKLSVAVTDVRIYAQGIQNQ